MKTRLLFLLAVWAFGTLAADGLRITSGMGEFTLKSCAGGVCTAKDGRARFDGLASADDGRPRLEMLLPVAWGQGGAWRVDDATGEFPFLLPDNPRLCNRQGRQVAFTDPQGRRLALEFPKGSQILIQDNRAWNWSVFALQVHLPKGTATCEIRYETDDTARRKDFVLDRFGQVRRAFPGKIVSADELKRDAATEGAYYASLDFAGKLAKAGLRLNRYGGIAGSGTALGLKKTGFFHVEKKADRWHLVDPEGDEFFQLGVCAFGSCDDYTYTEGREEMFEELPPVGSAFDAARIGSSNDWWFARAFSHYRANLIRKFGTCDAVETVKRNIDRVRQMGFNSMGGFCTVAEAGRAKSFPYVEFISSHGTKTLPTVNGLFDPFDPQSVAAVERNCAKLVSSADDPLLIGYFLGNEQSFEDVARGVPSLDGTWAAKRRFVESLRARYADVAAFNAAWGTACADFAAVEREPLKAATAAALADAEAFAETFVEAYYGLIERSFRKVDRHHMLIGSRWTVRTADNEMICRVAGRHLDIVSINYYTWGLDEGFVRRVYGWSGRPQLWSEFFYSAAAEANPGPFCRDLATQRERGLAYRNYVEGAAAFGFVVGTQWFSLSDQSATGRFFQKVNGESFNDGILSVTDRPYKDMIEGMLAAHLAVYPIRRGRREPFRFRDSRFAPTVASACAVVPYRDAKLPVAVRVDDLIARMSLAEKVAQLSTTAGFGMYDITAEREVVPNAKLAKLYRNFPGCGLSSTFRADWYSGRNWKTGLTPDLLVKAHNALQRFALEQTRLGIPLSLSCGQMLGETTVPSGLGCAATWDLDAIAAGTAMRLRERATVSRTYGIGHPTADLALDPRWSRVEQTFGEDPFLSAEINFVRCQTAQRLGGSAHVAHFVGHGCGEGGRMSLPVHVGMNELYNLHLRPFEYAVKGGADNIMTCYNLIDGVPGLIRGDLVNGFVRGKLGFRGTFVADAGAICNLVGQGFARDLGEAAALAVKNGNDTCCWEAENYLKGLTLALQRGLLTEAQLDVSVRRVLTGKFVRGLFDHPYVDADWAAAHGRPEDVIGSSASRKVVLELARKAMTLLENPKGVLPLDARRIRRLAVIGPNADKPENQLGDYTAPQRPGQTVTPRMGFERLGKELGFEVDYALGCKVRSLRRDGFAAAIEAAKYADAVVLCLGGSSVPDQALTQNEAGTAICERIQTDTELDKDAGEGFDRATLRLGGVQNELLREIRKLGKPVVTVLIMGRPIVLDEVNANSDAVLLAWYPGTEGGTAIAETVFGLNNPGGKLPVSFPRSEGALPCYYHALCKRGNYVDMSGRPLYDFGYGLSYTRFVVDAPKAVDGGVEVRVTNVGERAGDDVVQLYLHDELATVARPVWELRGFRRVSLAPGESRTLTFALTGKELGYWNGQGDYVVEPGLFKVAVSDRYDGEAFARGKNVITYRYGN